jgi:NitT/TauT family transport system substrate-binding protein
MRVFRFLAACVMLALVTLIGVQPTGAADTTHLTITLPSIGAAESAYFIAQQKGYFTAEGLSVEFSFSGGGIATPALISGSVQGSASGSAALGAILRGADVRVVAVFGDSPAYALWVRNDIKTLDDLKGKSVGVNSRGDTFEIATRLALQDAGMSGDAVGYSPLGIGAGPGAAFATGALPAVVLSARQASLLEAQGQLKTGHRLLNYYGKVKMPWNAFAVSGKLIHDSPDVARRMMRAIVKGARYMRANKAQTIAIVEKYHKDTGATGIEDDYNDLVAAFAPTLTIPLDVAEKDFAVRAALANISPAQMPSIDKAYDFSMVRSINAELDAAHWKPLP